MSFTNDKDDPLPATIPFSLSRWLCNQKFKINWLVLSN